MNIGIRIVAPISSTAMVPRMTYFVSLTIPPRCGAEIAFCIVLLWLSESLLPESITKDIAIVMTPRPPTWIRASITI